MLLLLMALAGKAIIGSAAIDGVNNTITTGGNKAVTLYGTTGVTGKAANIGGVTVDGTKQPCNRSANTTGMVRIWPCRYRDQLKVVADAAANQT